MPDLELRSKILLSVQKALVGCITPTMRFISVEWSRYRIHLHVYIDGSGPMCDDTYELFEAGAMTRIVADFSNSGCGEPQVLCTFHRCDYPERPAFEGELVYGRREGQVA